MRAHLVILVERAERSLRTAGEALAVGEPPGLFGEMALIESQPRALTATVETDAELVEIPVRTFWVLVNETPYFAQLVMRVMAERLRRASGT